MNYRQFGNTGEKISALGFGCMRLPEVETDGKKSVDQEKTDVMLARAFERGVNYFDTAPYYCDGNSEAAVGHAVKGFRDKILLATKCPVWDCNSRDDYFRFLEQSLKRLDTDHIDFYHLWSLSRESYDNKVIALDLLGAAREAKERGMIRHISFSFHDAAPNIKYIIDQSAERGVPMESMLVQYNLLDRSNEEMLSYAHGKGIGTVAMGPVGGGRLAAPTDLYKKLTGKESIATYELAFKFCLGNPDLSCALSGMQDVDMVDKNAKIASSDTAFSEDEWRALGESLERLKKFNELYCTGCKYCQPCPAEIDIPRIFGIYTNHNVYGLTDHAKRQYSRYTGHDNGKNAGHCIDCGTCEEKCPQSLPIREALRKADGALR